MKQTLREKVHEIETYRDILFDQIGTLQKFFDFCADKNINMDLENGLKMCDFKGEVNEYISCFLLWLMLYIFSQAITFRETTSGVLTTLNNCIDVITQKEEKFKKKIERIEDRRRKVEEELKYEIINDPVTNN